MSQCLLHQRWSPEVCRCSFLFCALRLLSSFTIYVLLFCCSFLQPSTLPQTVHTSLCGMHALNWTIIIKNETEFGASVVSKEGQLQYWISLQIKESLWGRNPVRHSLGRLYKGFTLNPLWVELNEITPAMCDTLWFFISFFISLNHKKSISVKYWVKDW